MKIEKEATCSFRMNLVKKMRILADAHMAMITPFDNTIIDSFRSADTFAVTKLVA